jgi:RNA processing factor Prp31
VAGRRGVYERPELASLLRIRVKFNVTRNDNHIIQAIATVDFQ